MSENEVNLKVDATGLKCPMPVIKAKKGIQSIDVGQVMEVLSTDPGSVADFKAWSRSTGNELVESSQNADVYAFKIRRLK